MTRRINAAFALQPANLIDQIFTAEHLENLAQLVDLSPRIVEKANDFDRLPSAHTIELLVTGWGVPVLTADLLKRLPALRFVIHTAGSVKPFITNAVWTRGIAVSSQAAANAIPVAEYTTAMIVLANKNVFNTVDRYRRESRAPDIRADLSAAGNYGKTVGIVGASMIGREVIRRLAAYDLDVLVADPLIDEREATLIGAKLVSLDVLIQQSDVVSLHAPSLPETEGMIGKDELAALRDGATFINTARAELVDQDALCQEAASGRISAVLDVVRSGASAARLLELPNVVVTPHMAGSVGNELHRLGAGAVDEVRRAVAGTPLVHSIHPQHLLHSA